MMLGGPPGGGPGGLVIEEVARGPGPASAIPAEAFSGLFPGPLMMESHAEESPFGAPDPLVMDMLQDIGRSFQEQVLPALVAGPQGGRSSAPQSCRNDLKKHCSAARSQLHCLGQHVSDISEPCRKDVGKSVPFLCSRAIDEFCDIMHSGILSCLESHVWSLHDSCKDAVLATKHVIKTATKGKVIFVDTRGGHFKPAAAPHASPPHVPPHHVPPPHVPRPSSLLQQAAAAPAQKEAALDARLLRSTSSRGKEAVQHPLLPEAKSHVPMVGVLILLGLAVAVCISFASTTTRKAACAWLMPFRGEGREPLRLGVELPKPTEL